MELVRICSISHFQFDIRIFSWFNLKATRLQVIWWDNDSDTGLFVAPDWCWQSFRIAQRTVFTVSHSLSGARTGWWHHSSVNSLITCHGYLQLTTQKSCLHKNCSINIWTAGNINITRLCSSIELRHLNWVLSYIPDLFVLSSLLSTFSNISHIFTTTCQTGKIQIVLFLIISRAWLQQISSFRLYSSF